jgi:flagellar protein FlbD
VILVTRFFGSKFYINAEYIQSIERMPDTVVTLMNEKKLVISDSVDELVERLIEYQRKTHQPFSALDEG